MYANDIVLFSETDEGIQNDLNCMYDYCQKWKLSVNTQKNKCYDFQEGGHIKEKYSI